MKVAATGLVAGILVALVAARSMTALLFEVPPSGTSEPRSGCSELEGLPGRSGVEER